MTITIHRDLNQHDEAWYIARNGILTASEFKLLISPKTFKPANNEKTRAHVFEIAAQRINGPRLDEIEGKYQSYEMVRGHEEEELARDLYRERFADVEEVGFVTNDNLGFTLGFSPDGLVGDDGGIECKSRDPKHQVSTAFHWFVDGVIPDEYKPQIHGGILVAGLKWIDLLSYSNGMNMIAMRVERDPVIEEALIEAATNFEKSVADVIEKYHNMTRSKEFRTVPTKYVKRDIIT